MRPIFYDKNLQAHFDTHGFVIVNGMEEEQTEAIKQAYSQIHGSIGGGFESTMNNPSPAYKKQVFETITHYTNPILQKHLIEYTPVTANFVIKRPHSTSQVPAHRDWSMCDETEYAGINIWVALDHCHVLNGALHILPGSHLTAKGPRGNKIKTNDSIEFELNRHKFLPLYIKKGQAIIYDLRCLHFSPPNASETIRYAAGCACIPNEAKPIHYKADADDEILVYHAPVEFYMHYAYGIDQIPPDAQLITKIQPHMPITDVKITPPTPIFKNPQHQEDYNRNGYVLIDYLNPTEVADILRVFNELTTWFHEGFMSSVYAPAEEYKRNMDKLLEPYAQKLVNELMPNYQVVISTLMVKGVGENSAMYPHQDWTLVDENQYASFNIWIPLVDVDWQNGAMSIMKGGHKMPFTIRGSNIPDALSNKSLFTPDKLTYMPMKAGQALIYDHRCIHVSPPNQTNQKRPACAIGIVPKEVEVFHYFYDPASHLLTKYMANKDFYFSHVATQFTAPQHATILDEQVVENFYVFTQAELDPFFAQQLPRKKGFWQKLFNK
jgi:ectoine hydroxylase-related dioxygenase (phytanoyl-CoA dioxygenase family)